MAFDFKKEYKEFYLPKGKPELVTVPPMTYVAVRGAGDPNEEGGAYKEAIGVLYAIAYTIKMSKMGDHRIDGYFDFVVPPLEGFWWQPGVAGVDCAVQAGIDGLDTLLIEKSSEPGGNGQGVEGMFAVGSSMQKELGIDIKTRDIVTTEMRGGQWRGDYSLWLDLVNKSAENIAWCKEQGVEYSGVVDNYYTGLYHTMHWFKNGHAIEGYVPQMAARVQELGVATLFETAATTLIREEGVVRGLYAEGPNGTSCPIPASCWRTSSRPSASTIRLPMATWARAVRCCG